MPRSRPKSVPTSELVLSTSSSDSRFDSDVMLICTSCEGERDRFLDNRCPVVFPLGHNISEGERIESVNKALSWLRTELKCMKLQDRELARTMIEIRARIQQVKLEIEQQKDTGYNSDEAELSETEQHEKKYLQLEKQTLTSSNNDSFQNNKRASWVI